MRVAEIASRVRGRYPDVFVAREEATVVVDPGELLETLAWLREQPDLRLDFLSSLTATDHPGSEPRFWVVYELRSMSLRHRVRIKVGVAEADPRLPTVTEVFPGANWHEREIFDLYGIVVDGHPDLTRILLPEDWEGHPLRKTEELGGVSTRYKGAFIPPIDERGMA